MENLFTGTSGAPAGRPSASKDTGAKSVKKRKMAVGSEEKWTKEAEEELFKEFSIGQTVWVLSKGTWHKANIKEKGQDNHPVNPSLTVPTSKIHYPGWGVRYDEWVMSDSIMEDTPENEQTARTENAASGHKERPSLKPRSSKKKKIASSVDYAAAARMLSQPSRIIFLPSRLTQPSPPKLQSHAASPAKAVSPAPSRVSGEKEDTVITPIDIHAPELIATGESSQTKQRPNVSLSDDVSGIAVEGAAKSDAERARMELDLEERRLAFLEREIQLKREQLDLDKAKYELEKAKQRLVMLK